MQNANLLFALGSLVFSLLLLFSNVLLIVFNEGEGSHQSGQVIVFVELLMMRRNQNSGKRGCRRLQQVERYVCQFGSGGSTVFLFVFARSCFIGAPFQMIEGICVLSGC